MRAIVVVACLLLASCGNRKNVSADTSVEETEVSAETTEVAPVRVLGIVHLSDQGCGVTIDVTEGEKTFNCYPVNIEDKYKVEGMKLKFFYEMSKAQQPEGCDVDLVISISDVAVMRTGG
jgi:hypothetical protein